jgi:uncharacterized glyoxalase superfamily protein PhnB
MKNRSVPVDTLLPHLAYQDLKAALAWLTRTFGFTEHYRYGAGDGTINGAQLHLGKAYIMLHETRPGRGTPAQLGAGTQMLTVFVADVDAHYEHTRATGAKIVEELNETGYGERQYGVEDLDGHRWIFSQHVKDMSPSDWGATLAPIPRP